MTGKITELYNPDMQAQQLRLHFGEMTAQEMRTARAAIRFANSRAQQREAERDRIIGEELREFAQNTHPKKNTHLLSWLKAGYFHCQNGTEKWCQGDYLDSAREYISAFEATSRKIVERLRLMPVTVDKDAA